MNLLIASTCCLGYSGLVLTINPRHKTAPRGCGEETLFQKKLLPETFDIIWPSLQPSLWWLKNGKKNHGSSWSRSWLPAWRPKSACRCECAVWWRSLPLHVAAMNATHRCPTGWYGRHSRTPHSTWLRRSQVSHKRLQLEQWLALLVLTQFTRKKYPQQVVSPR